MPLHEQTAGQFLEEDRRVRLFAVSKLKQLKAARLSQCEILFKDRTNAVRWAALDALIESNQLKDLEIIDAAEKERDNSYVSYFDSFDREELVFRMFLQLDQAKAQEYFGAASINCNAAYRVLGIKGMLTPDEIRADLDNDFVRLFENSEVRHGLPKGSLFSDKEDASVRRFIIAGLRSAALHVLLDRGEQRDIVYARKYLNHDRYSLHGQPTLMLIEKWGDHNDVSTLIALAKKDSSWRGPALRVAQKIIGNDETFFYRILAEDDEDLLVEAIPRTKFASLEPFVSVLERFLDSENDHVRDVVIHAIVRQGSTDALKQVLQRYETKDTYYYNVVACLDAALFAPEPVQSKVRNGG